ncbi:unnamed protein product [Orchesella dallaii]|uniref:Uncharacterized protein n=1 Tax=Orchesella dallaii TaxID=48710 RepID=A0ABP1S4F9_9HEXA
MVFPLNQTWKLCKEKDFITGCKSGFVNGSYSFVERDYCTTREYEKGAEITSTLEATNKEKQKQRRKVSKQKKPCLTLMKEMNSDEAKSDDSLDSSVGNLSLVVPSDEGNM